MADDSVTPFRIDVPQDEVDLLRARIRDARWPPPQDLDGRRGIATDRVRELAEHWGSGWDWRAQEAALNAWPQVTTTIDGTRVHAIHVRSPHAGAVPLVLLHGWPGSVVEFLRVIGPLTDPVAHGGDAADAFHVVVPSLPGYGFSGPTPDGGWTTQRMAAAIAELVARLGYEQYVAHGGDWGSAVTRDLAVVDGAHLLGIHVTMTMGLQAGSPSTPDEQDAADKARYYAAELSGYNKVQATRPLPLAVALTDSPVGQLAWIAERFEEWTDPASRIDVDQLLTNVAVYWFTRTAGSSSQLYWERRNGPEATWADDVPTGVTVLPHDLFRSTRQVVADAVDLVSWTELDRGGHFPAMEVPDLLVGEIQGFVRALEVR